MTVLGGENLMSRKLKFSKKEFMNAYNNNDTTVGIACQLDISMPTAYNYLCRFNLEPKTNGKKDLSLSMEIFECYRGLVTMNDIGSKHSISAQTVREHLRKAIHKLWYDSDDKPDLPPPTEVCHVKVYHELVLNSSLYDDVSEIINLVNLPSSVVMNYLSRIPKKRKRRN